MALHSVGPTNMAEDEHKIGNAYQTWLGPIYFLAPLLAVQYLEMKWVIALGIGAALVNLHEIGGRLYDLCIRLRRTNVILRDHFSN